MARRAYDPSLGTGWDGSSLGTGWDGSTITGSGALQRGTGAEEIPESPEALAAPAARFNPDRGPLWSPLGSSHSYIKIVNGVPVRIVMPGGGGGMAPYGGGFGPTKSGPTRDNYQWGGSGGGGGFSWADLLAGMPKFNFHVPQVSAGHVTAGHANSFHGEASLNDTNDPIYSLFAPKPWMSGMLSKGREYLSAATEDNIRLMRDNATRSGVSTSSPAYMYMVSMQRREQQQALANALRDANLAWTLPAADRRHGALGQNANTLTSVSMGNAASDTNVSIANAGFSTQASMANAGNQLAASSANASNSLQSQFQGAQLSQQGWMFQTSFIQDMWQNQQQLALQLFQMGGSGLGSYQGPSGADYANNAFAGGTSSIRTFLELQELIRNNTRNRGGLVDTRPPTAGASEQP